MGSHKRLSRREFLQASAAMMASGAAGLVHVPTTLSAPPAQETPQLVFASWEGGITREIIEQMLRDFTDLTGVEVTHQVPTESYMEKLQVTAAADQLPDVFYISKGFIADWAEKGLLMELTEQLGSDPSVDMADIVEANLYQINNHFFAAAVTTEPQVMFYSRDVFDDAGEAYPPASVEEAWTLDEIIEVAKRLTRDQNGNHPGEEGFDPDNVEVFGWEWWNWIGGANVWWMNGLEFFTGPDLMTVNLTEPSVIETYTKLSEIPTVHHIAPPAGYYDQMGFGMTQAQARGQIAMITGANWLLPEIVELEYSVGAAVLPKLGPEYAIWGAGEGLSIGSTTDFPDEAYRLLSYVAYGDGTASIWKTGLWMPQLKSLLADPEKQQTWLTEGVHPEEYPTAACIPAAHYMKNDPMRKGWQEAWDKWIGPAIDSALFARRPAEEVLAEAEAEANAFFAENPPWIPA